MKTSRENLRKCFSGFTGYMLWISWSVPSMFPAKAWIAFPVSTWPKTGLCILMFVSKKLQASVNSGFHPAWLQSPKLGVDFPIAAGFDQVQHLSKAECLKNVSQLQGILPWKAEELKRAGWPSWATFSKGKEPLFQCSRKWTSVRMPARLSV